MDVGCGQEFTAPCLDPALTGAGLTLRAMAITATVIGDGSAISTPRARIDVTAEGGRATACDSKQHLNMGPTKPLTIAFDESGACGTDQVGHLRGGRVIYSSGCDLPFSWSESRGLAVAWR